MSEPLLLLIAAAFLLAGFVKGVIGLGLPTVSMGVLAVTMQPSLAIVIGARHRHQHLANLCRPLSARHHQAAMAADWWVRDRHLAELGHADRPLCALWQHRARHPLGDLRHIGLEKFSSSVRPPPTKMDRRHRRRHDRRGSAATGVQVIPSMPFMQAIGMEKDELVQALGVSSPWRRWRWPSISPPPAC